MEQVTHSVVIAAPCRVEVAAEPVPKPQPGEVLVQTEVSAISAGTELLFYRGQVPANLPVDASLPALGSEPVRYPLRYGYACVGRVAALGEGVEASWLGRRVFAFHPHAGHFCAPVSSLLPAPADLTAEQAALLPNMETAVNFVMDGLPMLGERVAVVGQGVVGLLTAALLARFPLAHLLAVDPLPLRRAAALALGASAAVDPAAGPVEPVHDLVFEVSGSPAALDTAIALTGYTGRIVIGSWYGDKRAPIDLGGAFHRSRMRLVSSQVSTIDPRLSGRWDKARRFAVAWEALRRIDAGRLVTHRFPVQEAAAAYELLNRAPEEAIQVLLTYPPPKMEGAARGNVPGT